MGEIQVTDVSYIYGLYSSENKNIRYIGYSKNPLQRLKNHIYESKKLSTHKHKWIQKELNNGNSINIEILRCSTSENIQKCEIETILLFKAIGAKLVNGNIGGRGGKSPIKEIKDILSKSKIGNSWNKGKKRSLETIEKIRISNININQTNRKVAALKKIGKKNNSRKTKDEDIIKIFNLYNQGLTIKDICDKYNFKKSKIIGILYNKKCYVDVKIKHNLKIERLKYTGYNQYNKNRIK